MSWAIIGQATTAKLDFQALNSGLVCMIATLCVPALSPMESEIQGAASRLNGWNGTDATPHDAAIVENRYLIACSI